MKRNILIMVMLALGFCVYHKYGIDDRSDWDKLVEREQEKAIQELKDFQTLAKELRRLQNEIDREKQN